jgi:sugar phosphate isomerase/epimerase
MPLRFGLSIPEFQDTSRQIIVDCIPDFSRFNVIDVIRNAVCEGYSVVELAMDAKHIIPSSLSSETISRLVDLKDELGHSYTTHLPFWSVELASFNEHVRNGSIESTIDAIELAKPLEPEAYVLHITGDLAAQFSNLSYSNDPPRMIANLLLGFAAASVEEILCRTELNPRKIAVENVMFPFATTRDLIDDLDLSICFDTAHLLSRMSGTESVMDFYRTHSNRITEIHLQDATYKEYEGAVAREDHIALGRGIMSNSVLREFLLELVRDNFGGPLIFELTKDEAKESLNLIKRVVPETMF